MKKIVVFGILLSLILQIGCTKPLEQNIEGQLEVNDSIEVGGVDKEILTRSEKISDSIVELFGIDDSVTVIFNDIAVVGIVPAYDKELDQDLRESIINRVNVTDPLISQVYITVREKNVKQINEIIIGLLDGTPYDNYVQEINKIIDKVKQDK